MREIAKNHPRSYIVFWRSHKASVFIMLTHLLPYHRSFRLHFLFIGAILLKKMAMPFAHYESFRNFNTASSNVLGRYEEEML